MGSGRESGREHEWGSVAEGELWERAAGVAALVSGEVPVISAAVPVGALPPVVSDPDDVCGRARLAGGALAGLVDGVEVAGQDPAVLLDIVGVLEAARSALDLLSGRVLVALTESGAAVEYLGQTAAGFAAIAGGGPRGSSRGRLRTATVLADWFPVVEAAVARGELCWAHAEAVVRVANVRVREALAAIQGEIVAEARARVFESWLRWLGGVVGVLDDDGLAPPIESNRLRFAWVGGALGVTGELVGEHALEAEAAVAVVVEELRARWVADHELDASVVVPGVATLRALALVELCRRGHAVDLAATAGPVTLTTLVIHADDPFGAAWSPTGGRFPAEALGALRCDDVMAALVVDARGAPLWMGRRCRLATPAQRAAVHQRDGGCVFPGCDAPVGWVRLHHPVEWQHGGPTDADLLASHCAHHHVVAHRSGWTTRIHVDQTFSWVTPTGAVLYSQRHGRTVHDRHTAPPVLDAAAVIARARSPQPVLEHARHLRQIQEQRAATDRRNILERLGAPTQAA